jgi:ferritin-like metal-binding protein YciE
MKKNITKTNGRSSTGNGKENVLSNESSELKELFLDELKDIYWAEQHLVKALPKMEKAATSTELQEAFAEHTSVTENHVTRVEKVFKMLGEKPVSKRCIGMKGLTDEGDKIKRHTDKDTMARDAGLIISAQKVEHYEIAAYGSLVQLAKTLGLDEVADVLDETLQEEKETDEKLTSIAESNINVEAAVEQ